MNPQGKTLEFYFSHSANKIVVMYFSKTSIKMRHLRKCKTRSKLVRLSRKIWESLNYRI